MSKSIWFFIITSLLFSGQSFAGGNTATESITSIESRYSGYHAIYMTLSGTNNIGILSSAILANEGCVLADRAILLESDAAGKTEFAMLLSTYLLNKKAIIRVDGCVQIDPAQTQYTAPRIVKVQL